MTKKQALQKLQKLDLVVQVECIDYSPGIKGYVIGDTIINAPDLPSMLGAVVSSLFAGYTAEQLSNYAQSKFGFGINF